MGWNVFFLLHLFFAIAAMAGVHSQGDATKEDLIHNRAYEGEAVHSMMRSWLNAGTGPSLFNSRWRWYIDEHPCYENRTRANYVKDWYGINCSTISYQPEDSNLYHSLVQLNLNIDDNDSMRLVGELPPAITNLTNLEYLWIENARKLSGPLPAGLFCFSEALQYIKIFNCSFNGSISSGFGPGCGSNYGLEYLDLSRNSFTEMSPISSNVDTLKYFTNLTYLNVSNNQIKGEFVIWANSLEIVDISNNFITNIAALGQISILRHSLKSLYVQNNSISGFPINFFEFETLQDINLSLNNVSSIVYNFSNINVSRLQRISISKNKFQLFPEGLLHLPNLEEIILDSNNIIGELHMPNISCQNSKIKLISLLYNNITHFYPSSDPTSSFSEPSLLLDTKVFLYGNPICTLTSHKTKLLRSVCRINATFLIEDEELNIVKKSYKILLIIIACVSSVALVIFIMGFVVIQKLKKKISLLHEIQSEFHKRDVKPNLYSFSELKVAT